MREDNPLEASARDRPDVEPFGGAGMSDYGCNGIDQHLWRSAINAVKEGLISIRPAQNALIPKLPQDTRLQRVNKRI